ncbi:L2 protein [Felis domesticus papillomavirus 1]|uniref:Minor capsid protein L2 n=2 Tax=Lambdapapillomavirus 1 TaxID=181667 RepID=Q77DV7_9PAPI|nr:L2 protein [Felis domesticus papillomavirus 1]AAL86458.1 L2 protein [Felis domesticus papillomavirus 1]AAM33465.1 putative minor capsid protein L2 [Lambdapapillomavirus 1]
MLSKRQKRAAPKDIYPQCKISNTCPPDILNKAEQNTLADKILKYGSAGVFLGSLGIGTGRGTGGSLGYVPLGSGQGVRLGTRVTTVRPTLPVSSVGTTDVIPVDAVDPLGPAVLPGRIFPTAVEDPVTIQPPRFPSVVDEPVTVSTPATEVEFTTPKVTTDAQPAVLEVVPETREPRILSRTQYSNPAFEVSLTASAGSGETSASDHILVDAFSGGQVIGEQIPLQELGTRSFSTTIEEETTFTTSTPRTEAIQRPSRVFTSRRLQQVRVQDPTFLSHPRSLVTFQNPVFDESVDLLFEQDVAELALAAPNEDFRDLVSLSKPYFSRTQEGRVRISRLGTKATMRTRSGLVIGPQSHYYYDLSDIAPAENLELTPIGDMSLGEQSGQAVISSGTSDMEIISLGGSTIDSYPEEFLLDEIESVANDLQLVIGDRRAQQPISVPNLQRPSPQVFPEFEGVHVSQGNDAGPPAIPTDPTKTPAIVIEVWASGATYSLHPSLLRKRKRKRISL